MEKGKQKIENSEERREPQEGGALRPDSGQASAAPTENLLTDRVGREIVSGSAIEVGPNAGRGQKAKHFCTVLHKYPQSYGENPLAKISECSYYAHRLIGKKNFTSQFREAARVTPSRGIELNEKCDLGILRDEKARVKPNQLGGRSSEEKRHNSM
jgi:hypothetical protein